MASEADGLDSLGARFDTFETTDPADVAEDADEDAEDTDAAGVDSRRPALARVPMRNHMRLFLGPALKKYGAQNFSASFFFFFFWRRAIFAHFF